MLQSKKLDQQHENNQLETQQKQQDLLIPQGVAKSQQSSKLLLQEDEKNELIIAFLVRNLLYANCLISHLLTKEKRIKFSTSLSDLYDLLDNGEQLVQVFEQYPPDSEEAKTICEEAQQLFKDPNSYGAFCDLFILQPSSAQVHKEEEKEPEVSKRSKVIFEEKVEPQTVEISTQTPKLPKSLRVRTYDDPVSQCFLAYLYQAYHINEGWYLGTVAKPTQFHFFRKIFSFDENDKDFVYNIQNVWSFGKYLKRYSQRLYEIRGKNTNKNNPVMNYFVSAQFREKTLSVIQPCRKKDEPVHPYIYLIFVVRKKITKNELYSIIGKVWETNRDRKIRNIYLFWKKKQLYSNTGGNIDINLDILIESAKKISGLQRFAKKFFGLFSLLKEGYTGGEDYFKRFSDIVQETPFWHSLPSSLQTKYPREKGNELFTVFLMDTFSVPSSVPLLPFPDNFLCHDPLRDLLVQEDEERLCYTDPQANKPTEHYRYFNAAFTHFIDLSYETYFNNNE